MKDDLFHPLMVLLGFGLIKIYYMHRLTQDTVGLTGMRFFENYLTGQKLKSRLNSLLKPLGKFKKIVAKITNVKRIFKVPKGTQQGYKDNPAYKLYMVSVCLWGYIGYFMFYRVVYKSNFDTTLGNKFKQYDCFYNDIKCHNRKAFFYSRIIYATLLLWMFVMVFQIKYGLLVWSSTLIDFNRYNSIRFAIYSPIPFMRELLVIMSFTANKTALTLRDWLMIEDIKDTMTRSKFRVQEKDKRDFVRPLQSTAKILAAIAVVLVALLIVVGPMIPFSDFIKSNIEYKILSSQVKVDIVTAKGYSLNPFFSSNLMLRSDTIQDTDPKWSFLSQSEKRKETKPNFVKYIKMSRYSRDFYEYSNATQIPTDLETILLDSKIQIHLMMKTEEGEFKKEFHVPISSSHASEIKSVMQLDCKSSTINREIFLENIPMVYQLGNNFELEAVKEPIILKYLYKKWSLGVECSSTDRPYFYISVEKENNIEFAAFTKSKKVTLDMAAKVIGRNIQIFVLYIFLFYYIGITIVRENIFNKNTNTWYEEVPRPEVMFILIDAIHMARLQKDFLKEDMLYYFMMELLRNPEDLKNLTGSMLEHRLHMFQKKKALTNTAFST